MGLSIGFRQWLIYWMFLTGCDLISSGIFGFRVFVGSVLSGASRGLDNESH